MDSAIILSEGVFGNTYGKTANGLVRYSQRYNIKGVIDSRLKGKDAGEVLTGKKNGIPIVSGISEGLDLDPDTMIIGIATDGGFLPDNYRRYVREAIDSGLNIVSGLHEFLSDDPEFSVMANKKHVKITDVRKIFRDNKISFTGRINEVQSKKIAVLGTDSAIGKRTTAVFLNREMNRYGRKSLMIGTGQTAWMQGFPYTIVLDAIINDFVAGSLEAVTVEAWEKEKPEYMFLEGQGSIIHPAYPGSYEIIGACRPRYVILQHAPARLYYDGFEQFKIPPLERYIRAIELISDAKVIAISINGENLSQDQLRESIADTENRTGIHTFDPLSDLKGTVKYITDLN